MSMKRIVKFEKGYNCIDFECANDSKKCKPGAGGSHGVHGMSIRFLIKGEAGAVQFLLYTGFVPSNDGHKRDKNSGPLPADLGYHSPKPMYEGQSTQTKSCEFLDGKPCYYDGSSLNADEAYKTLINAGEDDLWRFLEEYYLCTFKDGDFPETGTYSKPSR